MLDLTQLTVPSLRSSSFYPSHSCLVLVPCIGFGSPSTLRPLRPPQRFALSVLLVDLASDSRAMLARVFSTDCGHQNFRDGIQTTLLVPPVRGKQITASSSGFITTVDLIKLNKSLAVRTEGITKLQCRSCICVGMPCPAHQASPGESKILHIYQQKTILVGLRTADRSTLRVSHEWVSTACSTINTPIKTVLLLY